MQRRPHHRLAVGDNFESARVKDSRLPGANSSFLLLVVEAQIVGEVTFFRHETHQCVLCVLCARFGVHTALGNRF